MKHPPIKRLSLVLLVLVLCASVLVLPISASGRLDTEGPTKQEIQLKWQEVTSAESVYDEEPSVSAPYSAGSLSESFLQSGLTYLNYIRFVANLPQVQMDATLNEDAQYGSVVMAANDTMTHYPEQPADMDDDFYDRGYDATSSSNICSGSGHNALTCLRVSIQAYMDDDGASNLSRVGHRRWLLNPTLLNVGFGFAQSESGKWYTATKVFDRSGASFDYDYISWPASDNFPTHLFETTVPWSITLNPNKFKTPDASSVRITITRQADGKTWNFDGSTGAAESNTTAFMEVNTGGYGVSNCIIFHPGSNNIDAYEGIFTVDVSGIYDSSGNAATLHYQVDFFDINGNFCDHSYSAVVTDATCTEDGYTTYTCTLCGDSYTGNTVSALGHNYGAWTTEKSPTCTETGTESAQCSRCGDKQTRSTDALGHTAVSDPAVAATCTETGLTEGSHCSVCNAMLTAQETVPALGHDFGEWVTGTPATCTEGGTEYAECSRCDTQDERSTDPLGHTSMSGDETPATCTETGLTGGTYCSVWDEVLSNPEVIPALGHDFGEWVTDTPATCTEGGTEYAECSRCDAQDQRSTDPLGHTSVSGDETPATCTETGLTGGTYCSVCDEVLIDPEVIPALGHDFSEWVTGTPATCTEGGTEYAECSRCDARDERSTDPLGHRYEDGICTGCGMASPVTTPDVPEILSCYSKLQTSVKVTWTTVENADGYELWRTATPDDADSWTRAKTITSGTTDRYTNQGLEVGVTYYYKVCAYAEDPDCWRPRTAVEE